MPGEPLFDALPPLIGGILCGGASRRMGSPKALLAWEGSTFVERIAGVLQGVVPEVMLLGSGLGLPASISHLPVVADAPGVAGPLAGLLAAFAVRPGAAWMIVTCDQPLLTLEALEWMIAERRLDRMAVLTRLAPEQIEPFPGIYEPACRSTLAKLAAPGALGSLQPLGGVAGVHLLAVPVQYAAAFQGANTPGELAALGRRAGPFAPSACPGRTVKDPERD